MRPLQERMQHAASKGAVSGERQKILPRTAMHPHLPVVNFSVVFYPAG